jgi:hypothetical protein
MGNACYHIVLNPLSSCVLFKNVRIKIYKTLFSSVVLYWCETVSDSEGSMQIKGV